MIDNKVLLSLDDITIIPAVQSKIKSRKECDPFISQIEGGNNFYPIIAAPMDSVVDDQNYRLFWDNKVSCVIPRTISLERRLELCGEVFCAFGLKEIESEFLEKTQKHPKLFVLIDIANGHMTYQLEIGIKLREKYGDSLKLMGGNIANPETYLLYDEAKFDYLRVGIGGGAGCLTSVQTAIHFPMASLLEEIAEVRKNKKTETKVIADGGIRTYTDIIKCLALGADYVMMGYTLSKCIEASGIQYSPEFTLEDAKRMIGSGNILRKEYHGMSTKEVQAKILGVNLEENRHKLKTSEGRREIVDVEYSLEGWTENLNSYLRSAMSYTESANLIQFKNVTCRRISNASREKLRK